MARIRTTRDGVPYLFDTVTGQMERIQEDGTSKPVQPKSQHNHNSNFDNKNMNNRNSRVPQQDRKPNSQQPTRASQVAPVAPNSTANGVDKGAPAMPAVESKLNQTSNEKLSNKITKNDDIVTMCKKSLDNLVMRPDVAARCIVGEIRAIYFKSVTKPSGYDLEVFCYLDKILFDSLSNIIECIICYGSKSSDIDLVKRVIKNAFDVVELKSDIEGVNKVIEKVFEVF